MWLKAYFIFSGADKGPQPEHLPHFFESCACIACKWGGRTAEKAPIQIQIQNQVQLQTKGTSPEQISAETDDDRPPVAMSVYVNCKSDDSHNSAYGPAGPTAFPADRFQSESGPQDDEKPHQMSTRQ